MIHPHTELRFISDEMGYGVVATRLIPKGTITWVLDRFDQILEADYVDNLSNAYKEIIDKYTYRNSKGQYILCWDIAKYVNHSYLSNCLTTAYEFEVATRDIHPGDQLTDDYGYLNIDEPFHALPEKQSQRKKVLPDDLLRNYRKWDKQLLSVFPLLMQVNQPLWDMLDARLRNKVKNIIEGKEKMDSILTCYYDKNGQGALLK